MPAQCSQRGLGFNGLRSFFYLWLACLAGGLPIAQEMPLEITERLWEKPGPVQDADGAPKVLIVSPSADGGETDGERIRYAGRVEPADARVTLNGTELKVWPGGVFTGLRGAPQPGESATWTFKASSEGKNTSVKRTVKRAPKPKPLPAWPPAFAAGPVSPSGDWALPEGTSLKITVMASADAKLTFRVGEAGEWQALTQSGVDEVRGGRYVGEAPMPAAESLKDGKLNFQAVQFRLTATREGEEQTKDIVSKLRVAGLPKDRHYVGEVLVNRNTFLKNSTGWDRWGNWAAGTLFPITEIRGDRLRTSLGGASAYVDNENFEKAKINFSLTSETLVNLGKPLVVSNPTENYYALRWPDQKRPLAWRAQPAPERGATKLGLELLGARAVGPLDEASYATGTVRRVALLQAESTAAPILQFELGDKIWGYDLDADDREGLSIAVRTRPVLKGSAEKPLKGLKVMIDAGHGGKDLGALGPSGICEADLNLVQAAWLEKYLDELGAEIRQTRRDDTFYELDERVQLALDWKPDLFISLHHNSVGGGAEPTADAGAKLYYHYPHSADLSEAVAARLTPIMQGDDAAPRNYGAAVFRVCRNVTLCPSILVETGFVCNPVDEYKLRQTKTIKATAKAIAEAVAELMHPDS